MPHRRRYQYESFPFVPIHDWVLDCSTEGWGTFSWGQLGWDGGKTCADQRMGWIPRYPDFARRFQSRPHLQGGEVSPLLSLADFPLNHVGWLPIYPDFARRKQLDIRSLGCIAQEALLNLPDATGPISQSWHPTYQDRIDRKFIHPARMGGAVNPATIAPPLADAAQFPCDYQKYPDFARRHARPVHLYQAFTWRERPSFGLWVEPGVTPTSGSWTEPAQSAISTSWTEPSTAPVTSTWTEPAQTPVTPSPDRST